MLAQSLDRLDEELEEYYGALNQRMNGMAGVKVPPKPAALIIYEQMKDFNLPYVAGGLEDQPYILVQEIGRVIRIEKAYRPIAEAAPSKP